jgi:hypothetical protein
VTGLTMVAFIRVQPAQAAALGRYEDTVLGLLPDHGALVERRMRAADGCVEAHLLSFPSREAIDAFDDDPRRAAARTGIDGSGVEALRFLLEPQEGPQDIMLWRFVTDDWFGVLLERGQDLGGLDLLLVADVLFDLDRFVAAARELARTELPEADQLAAPEVTFYPGNDWVLRFAEGARHPEGVLVVFEGREAVRLEDLDTGDILE